MTLWHVFPGTLGYHVTLRSPCTGRVVERRTHTAEGGCCNVLGMHPWGPAAPLPGAFGVSVTRPVPRGVGGRCAGKRCTSALAC